MAPDPLALPVPKLVPRVGMISLMLTLTGAEGGNVKVGGDNIEMVTIPLALVNGASVTLQTKETPLIARKLVCHADGVGVSVLMEWVCSH